MSAPSSNIGSGIVSDPNVRGGEPITAGTSTPVRAIAELWNAGVAPEEIPLKLPHLELRQVFEALHYYLGHQEEIDRLIETNRIPEDWSGKRFDPGSGTVQG